MCRDLGNTETWHKATCSMSQGLTQPYFYCDLSKEFVSYSLVCDSIQNCSDKRDEDFCQRIACKRGTLDCGNGQCVDKKKQCDQFIDCRSNYDEEGCPNKYEGLLIVLEFTMIPYPAVVNFDHPGWFSVSPLTYNNTVCPETHFQCHHNGYCFPIYVRCNGMNDCPGHEDELKCQDYYCPGLYRCRDRDRTVCMHVDHLCDGRPQCPQHDDELVCDTPCPDSCDCYGLAFFCKTSFCVSSFSQIRSLEAPGSGIGINDVIHNTMLIHLAVQNCGWTNLTDIVLPNLHSLDLSENLLHSVNFSHFKGMPHLRTLNLAANPMSNSLFRIQTQFVHQHLLVFNISSIQADVLDMSTLSTLMPKLQVLDLSWNSIEVLQGQRLFSNIRFLDLQGNSISNFDGDFLKDMIHLSHVYTDNFKLCCSVALPDSFQGDCVAPSDELSSCDDLLKSFAYRSALMLIAVLAVLGNLGVFIFRMYFLSQDTQTGFLIFVLHLCVSDFFMGVYLVFIGVADRVYAGSYSWSETLWKTSSACSIAGFFSLLLSEVSAFFICLITLDRFIVLRFPFSQVRFGARSAIIACGVMWTLGFVLAIVPLLPATSHWEFFQQTGICIPLPVTRADFAGHDYSFSIMIVFNLILFLAIGVGQCLIYWSVRSSTISSQATKTQKLGADTVQSKESTLARRLLSVAISDFLCWFHIGLCGIMAENGVAISGEVNVAMAIVVLPLNSALNPFLYTLNIILEKRRKAEELHIQKIMRALPKA